MRARAVPLAVLALPLAGCASFLSDPGASTSQVRPVDDVTAVELGTSGSLTVTEGADPQLTVTAGDQVIDRLTSEVDGGRLVLDTEGSVGRLGTVRYELVVPRPEEIDVPGSGDVTVTGVPAEDLRITLEGSGDVVVHGVDAGSVAVDLEGSGSVHLDGRAGQQDVTLEGSGAYAAADLPTRTARVVVDGSGSAEVQVAERLDADVSGSGDVVYSGDPEVRRSVSGSGDVRPA